MDEIEVPTEHLHEKINEEAEARKERWSFYVALSTALMAVFAAISSLLAGDHVNEAVMERVKASDQWSYYQAKSIKAEIATYFVMSSDGNRNNVADSGKIAKYEQQKAAIQKSAEEHEKASEFHLSKHIILARAVTLFQVAIAIAAISILSKKRILWVISLAIALVGAGFLIQNIIF